MIKLIRELRRREVFRTVGLYVGVCWILIEAASILLPTFSAPPWALRGLVIAAIIGLPVAVVLAWVYDLTEKGIRMQDASAADAPVPGLGQRKMDFVVIGVLAVALIFSVYLNITSGTGSDVAAVELEPVSVLIADFENATDEPLFSGLLEQALTIGIELSPQIGTYDRHAATALGAALEGGVPGLPLDRARLVAVREGIEVVLVGRVAPDGPGFRLDLEAVEPVDGNSIFEESARAATKEAVLGAIGTLSAETRRALGAEGALPADTATAEPFSATSLGAAGAYIKGIELAFDGRPDDAVAEYRLATELDPNFGRAYAAWAVGEFERGRSEEAAALWQRALSLMDQMTERERLKILGIYYVIGTRNYAEAVATLTELVEKYPADAGGRNNLAVASFFNLDFERAAAEGRRILDIFPTSSLYRLNYALFAMYSSKFDVARDEGRAAVERDPEYGAAYLPLAIAALAEDDPEGARAAYARMATARKTMHRESTATLGLADLELYVGNYEEAQEILRAGIERNRANGESVAAAVKEIALAETLAASQQDSPAVAAANRALALTETSAIRWNDSVKIAAALVFLEIGADDDARRLAEELSAQINSHSRAYAAMIRAALLRKSGQYIEAIDALRQALALADLWRIRLELGRSYLEAGLYAEAFGEFQTCRDRRGEATAMFLDDLPTFRYLADLPYWLGRAQDGLGIRAAARQNYETFLMRRASGPLAEDARRRLE